MPDQPNHPQLPPPVPCGCCITPRSQGVRGELERLGVDLPDGAVGSSPIDLVTVCCPSCGDHYTTSYRPSVNLGLDPQFTPEYIESVTTGTCPGCGHVVDLGALIVVLDQATGEEVWHA
jgi:hypothetical protein